MGYVKCRSCDGIGKKFFDRYDKSGRYYEKVVDCKACSGTGINQKFYSKNCEKCYAEIIYPRAANYPPKYCRDCKERIQAERERQAAKWKTKSCKKCHQTIKYNVEWNKIPELCKDCIAKEKAKWKEKNCKSCLATIKYNTDWQKIPEQCPSCIEKERAKWKEKSCESCGGVIKFNIEWKKIPTLCKKCRDEDKGKWRKGRCEDCYAEISYRTDWDFIPTKCSRCKQKDKDCENLIRGDWEYLRRLAVTYESGHKSGWSKPIQGSINGHLVTVSFGFGNREGECLICDGHVFDEEFFKQSCNHDHYNGGKGPHSSPKTRGKYSGPGC